MSVPVKISIDWGKLEVCGECAEKLAREILKAVNAQRRGENHSLDISAILCDECWTHNTEETEAIKIELSPSLIRKPEVRRRGGKK